MPRPDNLGLMAVGDAMLDIVTEPETESVNLEYMEVSMSFQAGGSGVNLALAATDMGFVPVSLVCSLSADEDIAKRAIENRLRAEGVSLITNLVADCLTGITVIGYPTTESRILLTAPGANRTPLADNVVAAVCAALPDVVVVSGYMLFRPSTRDGVLKIMRQAARRGSVVILDLVPHSIHTKMTLSELRSCLHFVDFVAGGFGTFAGFATNIEDLLSEVHGALAYWPDGTYQYVSRIGSKAEGDFRNSSYFTVQRGMTERLLIWVLKNFFLASHTPTAHRMLSKQELYLTSCLT